MKGDRPERWRPAIVLTEANTGKGIEQLAKEILRHRDFLTSSGELEERRRERARLELMTAVESSLKNYVDGMDKDYIEKLVHDLVHRKTNPRSAAQKIINPS